MYLTDQTIDEAVRQLITIVQQPAEEVMKFYQSVVRDGRYHISAFYEQELM